MTDLPESLTRITQALLADEDLALWFESVMEAQPTIQTAEFRQMATRMHDAGEDSDLTHAIGLLTIPDVREGVLAAFRELRKG